MTDRSRAWTWVDHLRAGGTAPWRPFADGLDADGLDADGLDERAGDRGPYLPGAAQLEVVRRLNLAHDGPLPAELVDAVLMAGAPGRGQPDLPLTGIDEGPRFGPSPVDPEHVPVEELLRLVVGVLAERARAGGSSAEGEDTRNAEPLPLPWRRDHRLVGDPALVSSTREALRVAGHRRGARSPVVAVLADDLGSMLADLWRHRVAQGATPAWQWWVGSWARRDQLPPRLDLVAVAARWAERVGPQNVHVVVGHDPAAEVARLLGVRRPVAASYGGLSATATDLLRHVNGVLKVLLPAEEHQRVLQRRLLPLLAGERGPRRSLPPGHHAWAYERAERLRADVASAGYAVHGDLAAVLPAEAPAVPAPTPETVLELALRTLPSLEEGR